MRIRILAAALAALAVPAGAQQGGPPPVFVAQPTQRVIAEWDEFFGRLEAAEQVEIRARVSGFVEKVHFRDGVVVEKGAPLFTIDPRPFAIAVAAAQADLEAAQARAAFAAAELNRARPLAERRTISRQTLEERQFEARSAAAAVAGAEAALRQAELDLEWTVVTAPIAGRVSDSRVDVGNLISGGASEATLLTDIVSLSPILAAFEGSEADFLRYARLNQQGGRNSSRDAANPVEVRLADEDGWPHKGRMSFVDNVIDSRSGTIRARATLDEASDLLTPGLFVRVRVFGVEAPALLIPDSAVLADQARRIALVVNADDVVEPRVLDLGPIVDGLRVVRGGLAPDDRVIVKGLMTARPGMTVSPQPAESAPDAAAAPGRG